MGYVCEQNPWPSKPICSAIEVTLFRGMIKKWNALLLSLGDTLELDGIV